MDQFDSDVITLTVKQKTLTKADLTYSGVTEKVYDGTTDAPAGSKVSINSDALVGEDTLDVTGTIAYDTKNVTATKITFTPNAIENDNYRLAASEVLEVEASITAKPLTGRDFSKIAVTKVYDGTTDAGTLTGTVGFSGKVNTDDISIKAIPGVYADEKVGQNKHVTLTLSLEGKDSATYTLAENTTYDFGAASITKADGSVTAPAAKTDLVYNGEAQAWSVANGISDGTNPNGTITRAQMVTMLWRTAGSAAAESKTGFTDVSVDSYYAQAVAWAVENGITTGVGGGRFDPNATCTRAQIATFLARSLK